MVKDIVFLGLSESVSLEAERLRSLLLKTTPQDAEKIVCRAVEELALRLSHCGRHWRQGELPELRKCARSMIAISEQIGMSTLARVSGDVVASIDADDSVATAATQARLTRIGDASLLTIWDYRDLSVW